MIPRAEEGDPVDIRIMDFDPFSGNLKENWITQDLQTHMCRIVVWEDAMMHWRKGRFFTVELLHLQFKIIMYSSSYTSKNVEVYSTWEHIFLFVIIPECHRRLVRVGKIDPVHHVDQRAGRDTSQTLL